MLRAPILAVILSGAQRSRRTCVFGNFLSQGWETTTLNRRPFIRRVAESKKPCCLHFLHSPHRTLPQSTAGVVGWLFSRKEPRFSMHSTQPLHFNLVAAAHASMIEHGFQPDFPAGADTELAADPGAARRARGPRRPGPAQPALVLDRQRHLQGSGPDRVGRAVARWPHPRADRRGRRGRARPPGHGHRRPRQERNDLGLHRRQGLPHAARRTLRGHHLAERERRPRGPGHRVCRGRRGHGLRWQGLSRPGPQPRATGLLKRGRVAGGQGARRRPR